MDLLMDTAGGSTTALAASAGHHIAKRFVWPGISVQEVFLLLFRPERFVGWVITSLGNALFRMAGIAAGGG